MSTIESRPDGSSFQTEMEFTFEAQGEGQTRMTLHHKGFPTPELRDEHRIGLPNAFDEFRTLCEHPNERHLMNRARRRHRSHETNRSNER